MTPSSALVLAGSYLLGSIPFSFLIARAWGVDVRRTGSGNVGATNVLRTTGPLPGLLALLMDVAKGLGAVLAARAVDGPTLPAMSAAAVVVGHMFPVWLAFKGGKGVATGAGAFVPLAPTAALGAVGVFVVVLAATRYVSVGSMSGAAALAILVFALDGPGPVAWAAAAVAVLIVVRHGPNLRRLRQGTESRFRSSRAAAGPRHGGPVGS
jgi:glycerol-3-phosphate acyltransferase PlsY